MFVSIQRKADRDGFFLRTASRCDDMVFFRETVVPEFQKPHELLSWLGNAIENQRETVAKSIYDTIRAQIDAEQVPA